MKNINEEKTNAFLKELAEIEEKLSKKNGLDHETIMEIKSEMILTQDKYFFEYKFLENTLNNLQALKPLLHSKMYHTGILFQIVAKELFKKTADEKFSLNDAYVLAGYYCNIGFLAIESSLYRENYTTDNDKEIIKRHVNIGYDLLVNKGLDDVAEIVRLHHEKPNGTGYLKEQNYNDCLLAILNIVDEFIDSILPSKRPEPALLENEALKIALTGYESNLVLDSQEIQIIKNSIHQYYYENFRS